MKSLHALSHVTRIMFGAFAVGALLIAASAVAAVEPITSDQFAPGWQAHARPMFFHGFTVTGGRDRYEVPGILPTGEYVLVSRQGDKAHVIDGQRITVRTGNVRQFVFIDPGQADVQILPVADVPALAAKKPAAR